MELRTLRYFIEVANEENMTKAAEILHVSQSTISKQLKQLEQELGKKLFVRHSFSIELTEEGKLLEKRAKDILNLVEKVENEFKTLDDIVGGDIYFGLAETVQIKYLAKVIKGFKKTFPNFHYHITSGDSEQVIERLEKGLIDFALLAEEPDYSEYNVLPLPKADQWGLIIPVEDSLAKKDTITFDDLIGLPLFCSEQSWDRDLPEWSKNRMELLQLEGSFRLSYNGSVFVKEGLGYLLTFKDLINTGSESGLVFRPLSPPLYTHFYLIWKKEQVFTPIIQQFLLDLEKTFKTGEING